MRQSYTQPPHCLLRILAHWFENASHASHVDSDKHAENTSYPPPVCPAVSRQQSIQLLLITASCIDNVLSYAIK